MSPEEFKALAEKANAGTLTPAEELQLLQEINKGVDALREFIKNVKESH